MINFLNAFGWRVMCRLAAFASLMLLFTSCIEFEGQTLTYRYDRENDLLLCFQVYENIHHGAGPPKSQFQDENPSEEEKSQLESVMAGQRTFLFDNWLLEYDREEHIELLEKSRRDLAEAKPGERTAIQRFIKLNEDILNSVSVKNGGFYLNENNQLCGYQYVTVSNASVIVEGLNEVWPTHLQKGLLARDGFDETDLKKLHNAIDAEKWIQLNGNQFRVMVASEKPPSMECEDESPGCNIVDNFEIKYEKPFTVIVVGRKNQIITELNAPPSSEVRLNLIKHVRDTYGIMENVPIDSLRDGFLKTGIIQE